MLRCSAGEQSAAGGLWSWTESKNHINFLELLAATFAMKTFAKDIRNAHIRDNSTAVFYVNSMGGTHSTALNNPERNMSLTAEHLPGVDNCIADEESRTIQFTAEWQLHPATFQQIMQTLGWICL